VVFVVDSSSNARQMDTNAQLDFITSIVASLPVGQQHVRVGYLPYNTDILQSFGLGTFDDKHDVIVAISKRHFIVIAPNQVDTIITVAC